MESKKKQVSPGFVKPPTIKKRLFSTVFYLKPYSIHNNLEFRVRQMRGG